MKTIAEYQKMIHSARNDAEKEALKSAFNAYYGSLEGKEKEDAKTFLDNQKKVIRKSLDDLKQQIEMLKSRGKITYEGREYHFGEWITLADYARFYGVSIKVLHNWTERGIIPQENIVVLKTINSTKLIKNIPYQTTKKPKMVA